MSNDLLASGDHVNPRHIGPEADSDVPGDLLGSHTGADHAGRIEPTFDAVQPQDGPAADVTQEMRPASPYEEENDAHPIQNDHPFSPDSPLFEQGLTEDDVTLNVNAVPGVQQQKRIVMMLNPAEQAAALQQILEDERDLPVQNRHLILEAGALGYVANRFRVAAYEHAGSSEVAEAIMLRLRRGIHDTVVASPLLAQRENTEGGIKARLEAVSELGRTIEDDVEPLLQRLEEIGLDMTSVRHHLNKTVVDERDRLASMSGKLVAPTLGHRIFDGVADLAAGVKKVIGANHEEVGNVRQHRTERLANALGNLSEVTDEMRTHSGDAEWERAHGEAATKAAQEFAGDITDLVSGVEDQVDMNAVKKGLKSAHENMVTAADNASDEEHKNRLKQVIDQVRQMVEALAKALSKMLGLGAKGPSGPSPTSGTKFAPN